MASGPRLASLGVGPASPTWQPPSSCFILVSSGVFHILLVLLFDPFGQVVMLWLDSLHIQPCFPCLILAK
jgi:hypothetical protein